MNFPFRDPVVEARRKEHEESHLRAALNTAKSRQIRKEQNYDIVNHTSHAAANGVSQSCRVRLYISVCVMPVCPQLSRSTHELCVSPVNPSRTSTAYRRYLLFFAKTFFLRVFPTRFFLIKVLGVNVYTLSCLTAILIFLGRRTFFCFT